VDVVDTSHDTKKRSDAKKPHDTSEDDHDHCKNTENPSKYFHLICPLIYFFLMLLHHLFLFIKHLLGKVKELLSFFALRLDIKPFLGIGYKISVILGITQAVA